MRTMRLGGGEALMLGAVGVLLLTVLFPLALIFYHAGFQDGRIELGTFAGLLADSSTLDALWATVVIAVLTTIGATLIGTFFAWLVGRTDLPGRGLLKLLFPLPFMFPPFIGAMAWALLLSPRSGYLNHLWMALTGSSRPLFDVYSVAGIVLVEILYFYPFVFIQVAGALERMDPTLEESARISGAGLFGVMRRITLPLVFPSIVAGAVLVLVSSIAYFGVPAVLGLEKGIYTIPTKIYERINQTGGSFEGIRQGTALSVVLIVTVAAALALQRFLQGGRRYEIIAGKSMRPIRVSLRAWRLPLLILSWLFLAVAILMPAAVIFLVAGLKAYGLPLAWENLTLANFRYVLFQWEMTREAIRNGLGLSLAAAAITLGVGTIIAYVIVKTRARGRAALEMLAILPYAIPGTVLAIGVILAWSGGWGLNLYNTLWIILVAYVARYMAFAVKSVAASLEQVHPSLEEAARASGGTRLDAMKDVVLPLIRPGMVAGFLLIFLPAIRELTVSVLLYGPGTRTIGVATYALLEEGYTVYAAAMAAVTLAIMMIGNVLLRRLGRERRDPPARGGCP